MSITNTPPVRFPSGVSTVPPAWAFANYPFPQPNRINQLFTDFDTYNSGDWTATTTNSGTIALIDQNGGAVTLTSGATSGNVCGLEAVKKCFAFGAGAQVWYSINVSFVDATLPTFMAGLSNTFVAVGPTDGVYFSKAASSTTMNLIIRASSTSTTIAVGTVANATAYSFSFYYNPYSSQAPGGKLWIYSTIGLTAPTANYYPGGNQAIASAYSGGTNTLTNLPASTVLLTPGFAIAASSSAAKAMTVDYMLAGEEILTRF